MRNQREINDELLHQITSEYLEMPGLQLTLDQAQRLWTLDRDTCMTMLDVLVEREFLLRGSDNRYRRATGGAVPRARAQAAKADPARPATRGSHRHDAA